MARRGRAVPPHEELLNLLLKGVIAFPGRGITEDLVDKARTLGIPASTVSPTRRSPYTLSATSAPPGFQIGELSKVPGQDVVEPVQAPEQRLETVDRFRAVDEIRAARLGKPHRTSRRANPAVIASAEA